MKFPNKLARWKYQYFSKKGNLSMRKKPWGVGETINTDIYGYRKLYLC